MHIARNIIAVQIATLQNQHCGLKNVQDFFSSLTLRPEAYFEMVSLMFFNPHSGALSTKPSTNPNPANLNPKPIPKILNFFYRKTIIRTPEYRWQN